MDEVLDIKNYIFRHCYKDGCYDIYQKDTFDGKFLCFVMIRHYTIINTPLVEYYEGFERFADAYKSITSRKRQITRQKQIKKLHCASKKNQDEQ